MEHSSSSSVTSEYQKLKSDYEALQEEYCKLQHFVVKLKKIAFGKTSEKWSRFITDHEQLALLPTLNEEPAREEETQEKTPVAPHTRKKAVKRSLADLERRRVEHLPEVTSCRCCGSELSRIGEEVTEELEYKPAELFVTEHVKVKLACSRCKEHGVETALLPEGVKPLARVVAGPSLLSHVIVSKYQDHIPLYRQEQMFLRHGLELSRDRLGDWVRLTADLCERIGDALHALILSQSYLQADETEIKVHEGEDGNGKLHRGYLWAVRSPELNLISYRYHPTRGAVAAQKVLHGARGLLQTDFYAGYNELYHGGACVRVACLSHIRRRFVEAHDTSPKHCKVILDYFRQLYKIEKAGKSLAPPERQALRLTEAIPILEKLQSYLKMLSEELLPKHVLMEQVRHTLTQWDDIVRYTAYGQVEIDNNAIEREMRPIALGRKNYLFAGSHAGAERAALFYSLINSCRLHNVNAYQYLSDLLRKVNSSSIQSLHQLLPHRWGDSL